MYKGLTYGPVLITKGLHKGKIGYFDDTDTDNKLIIYPNMPTHCNDYYKVNISEATSVIPTKSLAERLTEIEQELCTNEHLPPKETIALLHERILCSDLLTERHLRSMQRFQNQDDVEVFISHSSIDLAFSRAIATDLMDAGFSVFLDDWSIDIGERIFEKISTGLCESKALIMVISKDYLKSVCCTDEWCSFYGKALHDKNCVIYPIIIDNSSPPTLISQIKYLRFNTGEYIRCRQIHLDGCAQHAKQLLSQQCKNHHHCTDRRVGRTNRRPEQLSRVGRLRVDRFPTVFGDSISFRDTAAHRNRLLF